MTQEEISKLKEQYGKVYSFEVPNATKGEEPHQFVFRKPDLKIIAAVTKLKEKDEIQATSLMINSCLVSGNKALLADTDVFLSLSAAFNEILSVRIAKVKEL